MRARVRLPVSAAAFAAYTVLSALFFGVRIAAHPGRTFVGGIAADPQIFIWSFAWWPHAIMHGQNPFFTHAIWAPNGFNLAWTTSVPGLALAFAPLTLAAGPVASYNVASLLMPALSAWTAFLLCRYVTRSTWPSLAGGFMFGFSSYLVGGEIDHMHTTAVFLVPVAALLVLRFIHAELSARRLTLLLALLLVAQMSFSTEVLFTLTLALVCALLLAYAFVAAARPRLRALPAPLAGAYALAALVASPFLYYTLAGFDYRPLPGAGEFVADTLNFVVPTRLQFGGWWSNGIARHFPGNDVERGAYIGVPALLIVGWFAVRSRRSASARFLLASIALAAFASLGSWLTVQGDQVAALPWRHLASRPLFDNAMPVRLSLFTSLGVAVLVAMWASSRLRPRWPAASLLALALLSLVPNPAVDAWANTRGVPSLFSSSLYRSCLRRNENVLTFPYGPRGESLLWQAQTGFWFRLAGGYISPKIPASFTAPAIAHLTTADNPTEVTRQAVLDLVRLKSVSAIVVDAREGGRWRPLLRPLGPPESVGGVSIYRPAGAQTSLHDTSRCVSTSPSSTGRRRSPKTASASRSASRRSASSSS